MDVNAVAHQLRGVLCSHMAVCLVRVEPGGVGVAKVVARWAAPFS